MCTLVCRWDPAATYPVVALALRDERISRAFDLPAEWWTDAPGVIGGRDRVAGGTWCASQVSSGVTAVVLNRPDKRIADDGAPSRGALPLLALEHGGQWPRHVDVAGMASFNLVLVGPQSLRWWFFDGENLEDGPLPAGTHVFKPTGLVADGVDPRLLGGRAQLDDPGASTDEVWRDWLVPLREAVPSPDSMSLLAHRELEDDSYETVFAQFIAARPGALRLDYLVNPAARGQWTTRRWPA